MKLTRPLLTPLFNAEIARVAKAENKTDEEGIRDLLLEIAALCDVKLRAVYHWRSGRHPLPSEFLPALCKRFGSNALLDEMKRLCEQTEVEGPNEYDLARLAAHSVREDMQFIEQILVDFESAGIQPGELARLRELAARAHGNLHRLMGIAEADCERRQVRTDGSRQSAVGRKENVAAKADPKIQILDSRKTGTR
jgi:hypothetical protein